jgi:hypothetical protein
MSMPSPLFDKKLTMVSIETLNSPAALLNRVVFFAIYFVAPFKSM